MELMDALLDILSALSEPTRLRIVALCARADLTVSELQQVLAQSQPRISRHLRILCDAGLLSRRREGTWTYYRLRYGGERAQIARDIITHLPGEDPVVRGDLARLSQVKETRREAADQYFRDNAEHWDRIRALHADVGVIERRLAELVPKRPGDHLLDIGTGTGRMLQIFAPHIGYGLGIDLSHDMLTMARVNLDDAHYANCDVRHGDMYRLPVDDGSFDIVLLHMVLHYAQHPGEVMQEAARALRPGGHAVLIDFAPHDNETLRDEHAHCWLGFSDADIGGLFSEAGLSPTNRETIASGALTVVIWSAQREADIKTMPRRA